MALVIGVTGCSKQSSDSVSSQPEKEVTHYQDLIVQYDKEGFTIDQDSIVLAAKVGETVVQSYTISKKVRTAVPLNLSISPEVPGLSIASTCNDPVAIQTCRVSISYTAESVLEQSVQITFLDAVVSATISGTDPNAANLRFLSVSPASLNFGKVEQGQVVRKTISVKNTHQRNSIPLELTGLSQFTLGSGSTCGESIPAKGACLVELEFAPSEEVQAGDVSETLTFLQTVQSEIKASVLAFVDPEACLAQGELMFSPASAQYDLTGGSASIKVVNASGKQGKICADLVSDKFEVSGCNVSLRNKASCIAVISAKEPLPSESVSETMVLGGKTITLAYSVASSCVLPLAGASDATSGINNINGKVLAVKENAQAQCLVDKCNDASFEIAQDGKSCVAKAGTEEPEEPVGPVAPKYDSGVKYSEDGGTAVYQ